MSLNASEPALGYNREILDRSGFSQIDSTNQI